MGFELVRHCTVAAVVQKPNGARQSVGTELIPQTDIVSLKFARPSMTSTNVLLIRRHF